MDAQTISRTDEQLAILDAAKGSSANLMLRAYAGTGKTSTLEMIEHAVDTKPILYLCFNRKIAEEAASRMLSTTTVRTFNSLGHRVWAKSVAKNLALDPKKSQTILKGLIDEVKDKQTKNEIWACFWDIVNGVALAKALGYVPDGKFPNAKRLCAQAAFHAALDEAPDDFTADLIDAVLLRSIALAYAGTIDFNDQIYMPALFGGTFPRFPLVMVDESQDLSPVNHAMLARLAKGRLVVVGDPYQSIYQFRGAVESGMEHLCKQYSASVLNLSVSFRCPSEIVRHVHWRVPNFKWSREGGSVDSPSDFPATNFDSGSTILCRNNAPLFKCALDLLSAGHSVHVSGSDIGPKIIGLMKKLGPEDMSQASLLSQIDDWLAERLVRESKTAQDLADCMKVFASFGNSLGQAISYAEHLFAQKGTIRLMTGHKAKGLEFDTVYHLDSWLCSETEQDMNLRYVISTRSRDRLIEIDSANIRWA